MSTDYNCVIKSIVVINEEGIWDHSEIYEYINSHYDIKTLPYGQVFHIYNLNEGGDELHEFFVVYDGQIKCTDGDQYFFLNYDLTKNITDICAKYPEFQFSDQYTGTCLPKEMNSQEICCQAIGGYIRGDDKLMLRLFGGVLDESYNIYINADEVEITKGEKSIKYEYDYEDFSTEVSIKDIIQELN